MIENTKILVIDDDNDLRVVLRRFLEERGFQVEDAIDGIEALAKLSLGIGLVLCDIRLPGIDGFEILEQIRKAYSVDELPVIMVTAVDGKAERLRAVELGANDFIGKPVDPTELAVRLSAQLRLKRLHEEISRHEHELEDRVAERTQSLTSALEEMTNAQRALVDAYDETISKLAVASEYKDEDTGQHIIRVSRYTELIAQKLALPPSEIRVVTRASILHDVGKIGIPDRILLKPGKFTPEEFEIMKEHTIIGGRILGNSNSELLQAGSTIALSHHEKWDGSGYPHGLTAENIPNWGRICAVADVFDALTTRRPYKDPVPFDDSIEYIREQRGLHFDPAVADAFLSVEQNVRNVYEKYNER